MLWNSFWNNGRLCACIMLSGYLWIAAPIATLAVGIKGFGMGIFCYAMQSAHGTSGLLVGLLYLIPQSLCYIPGFLTLFARSIQGYGGQRARTMVKNQEYLRRISPSLGAILIGTVLECTIATIILRLL